MESTSSDIKVSIKCLVYNHEATLRQCLEGFVMQKTNFPFEIIIHDDASNDNSVNIIREYAEKYPSIIKPIYEAENQYKFGCNALNKAIYPYLKGKYIALCEGDDYWIDPYKLQKQVDFLDNNPDYAMCFHNCYVLNETHSPFAMPEVEERDYNPDELYQNWIVPTASIVGRRDALPLNTDDRLLNGDIFMVLSFASVGKIRGMKDTMSVYRFSNSGVTRARIIKDKIAHLNRYFFHYDYLEEKFSDICCIDKMKLKRKWVYTSLMDEYVALKNYKLAFKCLLVASGQYRDFRWFLSRCKKMIADSLNRKKYVIVKK